MTIRVAITGATGKLGRFVDEVVAGLDGVEVVARLGSSSDLAEMRAADVLVDVSHPAASPGIVDYAVANGLHVVIGTSGWTAERIAGLGRTVNGNLAVGVLVVPNFSIGSVLATTFARIAAPYYDSVEIIEAHASTKVDSPSGTAIRTAELIAAARVGDDPVASPHSDQRARGQAVAGVQVHSLRLHGIGAQQQVRFAGDGEQLVLQHDTAGQEAYRAGIRLALERIGGIRGVVVGLDALLGLDRLAAPSGPAAD